MFATAHDSTRQVPASLLTPKTRRNIIRILPFGIIWFVTGLVFGFVERAFVDVEGRPSTGIDIDPVIYVFGMAATALVGLLVGTIEVLYLAKAFREKSFLRKMVYKTGLYLLLFLSVNVITYPIAASLDLDTSILDPRVWDRLWQYMTSVTHISTELQLGVALVIALLYAEVSDYIGHDALFNFFTGKYHHPAEEQRVFMFADMKDSTAIAERLGHTRYFAFLRQYYEDMTDAIVSHSGEVYKYVGDEIIVSWPYADQDNASDRDNAVRDNAVRDNAGCIRCFFAMQAALAGRADWYTAQFGVAPTFKAGIHLGAVTTGQIGTLRKELMFTGDVLNTTARIQALCNDLGVDLLISSTLKERLNLDDDTEFETRSLGTLELRGKKEELELFAVSAGGQPLAAALIVTAPSAP